MVLRTKLSPSQEVLRRRQDLRLQRPEEAARDDAGRERDVDGQTDRQRSDRHLPPVLASVP